MNGFVKRHFSALLMAGGSAGFFLTAFVLREALSPTQYGEYGLLISISMAVWSFGLLGVDQTVLRFCEVREAQVRIPRALFCQLLMVFFFTACAFAFGFGSYFPTLGFLYGILFYVFLIFLLVCHSFYRVSKSYSWSQYFAAGWKLVFCLIVGLLVLVGRGNQYGWALLFSIFIALVVSLSKVIELRFKVLIDDFGSNGFGKVSLGYFSSLLLINFLALGDRFIIERYVGLEELGSYFFVVSIVLFPFNFLQSYVGFKDLPDFKSGVGLSGFHSKLRKVMVAGVGIGLLMAFLLVFYRSKWGFGDAAGFSWVLLMAIVMNGVARLMYSVCSAALGATGTSRQLNITNAATAIGVVIVFGLLEIPSWSASVELIAVYFAGLWFLRFAFAYSVLRSAS